MINLSVAVALVHAVVGVTPGSMTGVSLENISTVVLIPQIITPARVRGEFSARVVVLHVSAVVVVSHLHVPYTLVGAVGHTVVVSGLGGDVTGLVHAKEL